MKLTRGRRALLALVTGLCLAASLPPWGWWPLGIVGAALLDRVVADQPWGRRALAGALVGLGLLGPTMWWIKDLTVPGYAIAVLFYAALLAAGTALCPPGRGRRLALPGVWLLIEAVRSSWPFGGVPLSLLAMGQAGGPLAAVARVGGVYLLGLVTVAAGVALSAAAARRWRPAAVAAAAVALALVAAGVAPRGRDTGRSVTIAFVQGGGPQGTYAIETDPYQVFLRHLRASGAVRPGTDITLWPEDVVDTPGPVGDYEQGAQLAALARRKRTELLAGVVEGAGPTRFRNASLAYDPSGRVIARYDKVQRVPFGEWVPFRSLIENFAPETLTSRDAIAGRGPAVLRTPKATVAVAISWEIFFGRRARDGVRNGGEVLVNPTNGSTYTGTLVQSQQIASSRLRAIETGRWTVQAAPTGFSAFVSPGGRVFDRTGTSERVVAERRVTLRRGLTLATRFGDAPWVVLGLIVVAAGWLLGVRRAHDGGRIGARSRSGVDDEGHGPVVDQLDLHVGAEAAGGHGGAEVPQPLDDRAHQRLGDLGTSRGDP